MRWNIYFYEVAFKNKPRTQTSVTRHRNQHFKNISVKLTKKRKKPGDSSGALKCQLQNAPSTYFIQHIYYH